MAALAAAATTATGAAVAIAALRRRGSSGGARAFAPWGRRSVLGFRGSQRASVVQCFSSATATDTTAAESIDSLLKDHSVVMFSKSTCPYCARAREVLEAEGVKFHVCTLDQMAAGDARAMQDSLMDMTGARTVPRIFFGGKSIGGCDDLMALQQSGKLTEMVPEDARGTPKGPSADFKIKMSDQEWRDKLGSNYYILRQQGTEPPGTHQYDRWMPQTGYFACGACGLPLYSANSKFRSSCGWPVFDKCFYSEDAGGCHVGTKPDFGSLEIICQRCDSHLGHVFFDAFSASNPNGERH